MKIQKLQLNSNLNIDQLANDFRKKGRLRIERVLADESAEAILDCLKIYTAWELLYTDEGGGPQRLNNQQLEQTDIEKLKSIHAQVYFRASSSYQYMYKFFPMVEAITTGRINQNSMLNEIATFLNGADFIRLARQVTGHNTLVKIDPHATLYEPGHFKNMHDDMRDDKNARDKSTRKFAVALEFTKNWSANWGGDTQFYQGQNPTSSESLFPAFNTLTLFKIPSLHRTNMVAPFAAKGRYAVTGWLRDDPNITRLDLGDEPAAQK